MNWQLLNIVIGLVAFFLFIVIQSLVINGIKGTFEEGMIFEKYGKWVKELGRNFKFMGSCVKCMAVSFGGLMYWPFVLYIFGFEVWEVLIFVANAFCVSSLSFYFYKNL